MPISILPEMRRKTGVIQARGVKFSRILRENRALRCGGQVQGVGIGIMAGTKGTEGTKTTKRRKGESEMWRARTRGIELRVRVGV
jgi:hypothetical protein